MHIEPYGTRAARSHPVILPLQIAANVLVLLGYHAGLTDGRLIVSLHNFHLSSLRIG